VEEKIATGRPVAKKEVEGNTFCRLWANIARSIGDNALYNTK